MQCIVSGGFSLGSTERKEREKQLRRNDIIDAAERTIAAKGYSLATMDDIAKDAEFSKRTVYLYFSSKEQLYFEIMVRGYKIFIQMINDSLGKLNQAEHLLRVKQIGITFYDFMERYPDYFQAIMNYENGEKDFINGVTDEARAECYALGEEIFRSFANELTGGIETGEFRRDLDVVETAILLWSFVLGLFNTLTKKNNYIKNCHNKDQSELLMKGLDFLTKSIQSKAQ